MAFDRHVIDGKERLVWTCRAFDLRLFANPPLPFIRTGRCVAAAPRLAILPTDGEDIRTAAEKPSEKGNLVFDCRIPIDQIAGFFRRDNFDSSGLLIRCRLHGLDLGYDLRTLAFQRSEPRHEFGNSDVRSHHRRVWRVPAFFVSSLTNSTALGAASVRLRSNRCGVPLPHSLRNPAEIAR